jgi:hypothetical protein
MGHQEGSPRRYETRKVNASLRKIISFWKTTDFERLAAKLHQIPGMSDLSFSKTILEMIFSK